MEKDPSIFQMLVRLSVELKNGFEIADFWDGDLCAIGILRRNTNVRLVYISTFNLSPDQYYYACEVADSIRSIGKGDYRVVAKGQVEGLSALIEVVKSHLYNVES
jgi:hypothetical protein